MASRRWARTTSAPCCAPGRQAGAAHHRQRHRLTRGRGGADRQRTEPALLRLGIHAPPGDGEEERRQDRVRPPARDGEQPDVRQRHQRVLPGVHPVGGQARGDPRHATEPRRQHRQLGAGDAVTQSVDVLEEPRRPTVLEHAGCVPRAHGDAGRSGDRVRWRGGGRRVPSAWPGCDDRHAHVGRANLVEQCQHAVRQRRRTGADEGRLRARKGSG